MILKNKRGQESILSGDLPAIIMIVVSIGFFLSSLYLSMEEFNSGKDQLLLKRAAVDSANAFMKENAKIQPSDLNTDSEFWKNRINTTEKNYGVNVYAELRVLDWYDTGDIPCHSTPCVSGKPPPSESTLAAVKSFPIAVRKEGTDLFVYPGVVRVTIWK
jgi:hypothetical protein